MRLLQIAAASLIALGAPLHAATVQDPAADVLLWGGDISALSYGLSSDDAGFAPEFAMISGGVQGYDPAFVLLIEDGSGEVGYGTTETYSFDGDRIISFLFDLTGPAATWLGANVTVSLTFDEALTAPFGDDADFTGTAQWLMAQTEAPAPVPLPATLPLLAGAVAGVGLLRGRRKDAALV